LHKLFSLYTRFDAIKVVLIKASVFGYVTPYTLAYGWVPTFQSWTTLNIGAISFSETLVPV